jgi:hypothetical protein
VGNGERPETPDLPETHPPLTSAAVGIKKEDAALLGGVTGPQWLSAWRSGLAQPRRTNRCSGQPPHQPLRERPVRKGAAAAELGCSATEAYR